ncbi:MAG: hypothetical protein Q7L55_07080 [Actinomycetota bacterium]|nr:hypothetical protein [Actinomycetota bacterium]
MSQTKLLLQAAMLSMAVVVLIGQVILPFTDAGRIGGLGAAGIGSVSVFLFAIAAGAPRRWEFLALAGALFALAYITTQGPDLRGGPYFIIQILLPLVAALTGIAAAVIGWRRPRT